jgi:hypothetical protein
MSEWHKCNKWQKWRDINVSDRCMSERERGTDSLQPRALSLSLFSLASLSLSLSGLRSSTCSVHHSHKHTRKIPPSRRFFIFMIIFLFFPPPDLYDSPQPPFAFCLLSKKATARRMEASSSFTPPARRASTPNLCAGGCVWGVVTLCVWGGEPRAEACVSCSQSLYTEPVCGWGGGHALGGGGVTLGWWWGGSRVWHASPLAAFARTRTHTRTRAPAASTPACTCMRQQRAARPHPQVD